MITGPTSNSYISQRLRLRYADWGNPEKPPLILLHGGRDHARSWDWTAEALRADWRIIAPDLRGHGDSDWSPSGDYSGLANLYDLAQLIHQLKLAPVTIIAHSFGGNIALRYAGVYPENVHKFVAIEGLGPSPKMRAERMAVPIAKRVKEWIEAKRGVAGRQPHRYPSIEDAFRRMKEANHHLTDDQARHLTIHGVSQNEDGTYSWKFDPYMRVFSPLDMSEAELESLWNAITAPTLLLYGADSWASNPEEDGRLKAFRQARVVRFANAGHWLHHDQFAEFIRTVKDFL